MAESSLQPLPLICVHAHMPVLRRRRRAAWCSGQLPPGLLAKASAAQAVAFVASREPSQGRQGAWCRSARYSCSTQRAAGGRRRGQQRRRQPDGRCSPRWRHVNRIAALRAAVWSLDERGGRCSFRLAHGPRVPKKLVAPAVFGCFPILKFTTLQLIPSCPRAKPQQSAFLPQGAQLALKCSHQGAMVASGSVGVAWAMVSGAGMLPGGLLGGGRTLAAPRAPATWSRPVPQSFHPHR